MPRFWPCWLLGCASIVLAGCGGRAIDGLWHGNLPLQSGQECRIRLQKSGDFDFWCKRRNLAGTGRYSFSNEELRLEWRVVTEEKRSVETPNLPFLAKVEGPGNEIELRPVEGGPPLAWKRAAL